MTTPFTMRDLLSQEAILCGLDVANKKAALQEIARHAAPFVDKDASTIFNVLWERERLGTTGVGNGIAIPHGRLEGLDHVRGFFIRLAQPVMFESIDDKPVDLIFLLLAPEAAGADHLKALATVSRLLRDQKLCEQLRRAKDSAAIYRLLVDAVVVQAA